jgi:hypothetical protein
LPLDEGGAKAIGSEMYSTRVAPHNCIIEVGGWVGWGVGRGRGVFLYRLFHLNTKHTPTYHHRSASLPVLRLGRVFYTHPKSADH